MKYVSMVKGKKLSEETKKKISDKLKNRVFTKEHREKISLAGKGRKVIWSKKQIASRIKNGNNNPSDKTKDKMRKSRILFLKKNPDFYKTYNEKLKGKNNPAWIDGRTPMNQTIRRSKEYKLWRASVFERDDYTCIWCGQRGGDLNADHIKPFALYPELRFAIDNGRTLCVPCHRTTESYGCKCEKIEVINNG